MYANSVSVYYADFSDIKRRLLIIIKHAPQFINGLILREYDLTTRSSQ
jgi:hypothetical protein